MIQKLYETLCHINETGNVLRDEPMSRHTTFRIGGPAALFCTPRTVPQLADTVKACVEAGVPYYILGNGSNVLVSDAGYEGVAAPRMPSEQRRKHLHRQKNNRINCKAVIRL